MRLIECQHDRHAESILGIFNDAIVHSTALYDYKPRTSESMKAWFATKQNGNFPVIGFEDDQNVLMGFASYGVFRNFPAYKYTVEHSVYVDSRFRGQGLGRQLLQELITRAQLQNFHSMIGVIDALNKVSIALHQRLGFVHCGTIQQAGFKFGAWLDLNFYQLLLSTPSNPLDG